MGGAKGMRCLPSERKTGEIKEQASIREMETAFSEAKARVCLDEHTSSTRPPCQLSQHEENTEWAEKTVSSLDPRKVLQRKGMAYQHWIA